jgi:hypothetical protein
MLMPILIVVVALVVILVVVAALRPDEFRVTRSAAISAPPATVFEQVNDLHKWEEWSPWAKLDPAAKSTYEGPPTGVGAAFAWSGNNKIGQGRMTITESKPEELVKFNLEFLRPFKATNTAEFTFKSQGGQTVITWTMLGKNNFMSKAMGLFMSCDKMVGGQFEQGLAELKSIAEAVSTKEMASR